MVIRTTLKIEAPTYGLAGHPLRLTIPVREALEAHHNMVNRIAGSDDWWSVRLSGIVPKGIVECLIDNNRTLATHQQYRGLRLINEPKYPGEWAEEAIAWWERGAWVPCPVRRCGRALVWYEVGYVPGYRVCTRGHHVQLSQDGRNAKPVIR